MSGSRKDKDLNDLKRLLADISQDVGENKTAKYEKMINGLETLLRSALVKNREVLARQITMTLITAKTSPADKKENLADYKARVKESFDKLHAVAYESNYQMKKHKIEAPGNDFTTPTPRRKIK